MLILGGEDSISTSSPRRSRASFGTITFGDLSLVNILAPEAYEEYIGNAGCHGRIAAGFAHLIVTEECHGVHRLLVPPRGLRRC
ncbi:MAG: hypothetical protein ACYC91_16705 [Solirubrobacteraceae bacterium]